MSAAAMTNSGASPHSGPPRQVNFHVFTAPAQEALRRKKKPPLCCCFLTRVAAYSVVRRPLFVFFLSSFYALHPHTLPPLHISSLRSLPAEMPSPGVRSGVIYHSRLRGELTSARPFGAAVVIDSPCLFLEDTGGHNCVRTPLGYILPVSARESGPTGEISFCIA